MMARWLEKLGRLISEIRHNAGNDIPHAERLSRAQTKENAITTLFTALTKSNMGIENKKTNPWQRLPDNDRKIIELKQKQNKEICKVFVWLEKEQRPVKRQMTWASKQLWKFWFDYQNIVKVDGLLCRNKKFKKVNK